MSLIAEGLRKRTEKEVLHKNEISGNFSHNEVSKNHTLFGQDQEKTRRYPLDDNDTTINQKFLGEQNLSKSQTNRIKSKQISRNRELFNQTDSASGAATNYTKLQKANIDAKKCSYRETECKNNPIASSIKTFLIILESIICLPGKLLRFLCGQPLSNIQFRSCSLVESSHNCFSSIKDKFFNSIIFGFNTLIDFLKKTILSTTKTVSAFFRIFPNGLHLFKDTWDSFREKLFLALEIFSKFIKNTFGGIFGIYRTFIQKAISIYLPNQWIQVAAVFLIKTFAALMVCCLAVVVIKPVVAHFSDNALSENNSLIMVSRAQAQPSRKLKHFFRDPLILKQRAVSESLAGLHIDAVHKNSGGNSAIMLNEKMYQTGAIIHEHPTIRLEKIGKNSIHFSDKYGQTYKCSINDLLE